jgi:cyclic pyranopterin phosphate synthase
VAAGASTAEPATRETGRALPRICYGKTPMPPATRPQRSLPLVGAAPRIEPRTVRISLTDRCDLACVYCRPSRNDGYLEKRLDDEAWKAMVSALVRAGLTRFRITGGEPLLHPRVTELVSYVASLGVEDLALTTNATLLEKLARPLREAGLRRLTVSLDSLVPERFWRITRGGRLERVLAGIDAALGCGFEEMKINTVVLRGDNDDELPAIVQWAWERGIVPRFIEVMRVGEGANLPASKLVGHDEMRAALAHLLVGDVGLRDPERGPAKYVASRGDPSRRVGFITGTTDTYCDTCDRLRVASDGTLRPCLATNDGVSGMELAQQGNVDGLVGAIGDAWAMKPDGRVWKGCTEDTAADVSMRAIGG